MSARWLTTRTLRKCLLPGISLLGCVSASAVLADPPREPERPPVRPATDTTVRSMQAMLEKLRKDLGPNDPAVVQLEATIKQLSEKRVPRAPAAPADPVPQINPEPLRGDGDDFFDLAQELQDQMDVLRNALQGRGGIQIQGGGGMIGPIVIGPGGFQAFGENAMARRGRFGIRIEVPSPALAAQVALPNGQGLVCADVPADSVAGKAGIKPFDILLEVAGKPVPSNAAEFVNQLRNVKADQPVDIVLLRKGRKETIKDVKLPDLVEAPPAMVNPLEVPLRPLPQFQPRVAVAGEQFSVQQQNNAFTIQYSKDGVKMTITGDKEDGKPTVGNIEVEANGKVTRADSVEKLPKEFQGLAERALKNLR